MTDADLLDSLDKKLASVRDRTRSVALGYSTGLCRSTCGIRDTTSKPLHDLRIPLPILGALLIQTAGFVYWTST